MNNDENEIKSNIYRADLLSQKQSEIAQIDFLIISNYFINECTKKYYEQYRQLKTPVSFIEFYFEQVSRYKSKFNEQMTLFFDKYRKKEDYIDTLCNVYCRTFSKAVKFEDVKHQGKSIIINKHFFPIKVTFDAGDSSDLRKTIVIAKDIAELIYNNEEARSLKTQYVDYLKNKVVALNHRSVDTIEIQNNPTENVKKTKVEPVILKGAATKITPEKVSSHVSRIVIPKYKLPSLYPVSFIKSRVDSEHVAKSFINSVDLIRLLNIYNITSVAYSEDFVLKRKSLIKPKQKKFSDFF